MLILHRRIFNPSWLEKKTLQFLAVGLVVKNVCKTWRFWPPSCWYLWSNIAISVLKSVYVQRALVLDAFWWDWTNCLTLIRWISVLRKSSQCTWILNFLHLLCNSILFISRDLRFNQIRHIPPGSFKNLNQLNTLLLNNNHLRRLRSGVFSGLHHLEYLYLYKNQIRSIDHQVFDSMPNLKHL